MFWRKKVANVAEPAVVPVVQTDTLTLKPEQVKSRYSNEELLKYSELAESLGFKPGQLLEVKFKKWLEENQIPVYSYEKVRDYLDKKFDNWSWIPLRAKDCGLSGLEHCGKNGHWTGGIANHITYHKAVPFSVLETVKKIETVFPDLKFFVSDQRPKGDPFLLVTAVQVENFVVECWDEPNFYDQPAC